MFKVVLTTMKMTYCEDGHFHDDRDIGIKYKPKLYKSHREAMHAHAYMIGVKQRKIVRA